jgi:hypothetical protein
MFGERTPERLVVVASGQLSEHERRTNAAHRTLAPKVVQALREAGLDTPVVLGDTVPDVDMATLLPDDRPPPFARRPSPRAPRSPTGRSLDHPGSRSTPRPETDTDERHHPGQRSAGLEQKQCLGGPGLVPVASIRTGRRSGGLHRRDRGCRLRRRRAAA